jgi:hypothetical protein
MWEHKNIECRTTLGTECWTSQSKQKQNKTKTKTKTKTYAQYVKKSTAALNKIY